VDGGWLVGVGLGESVGYEHYGGGSEGCVFVNGGIWSSSGGMVGVVCEHEWVGML
jgi:hypothetical protein